MTKSLAMISGGLDSILAAKLIKEQGIDVLGICFRSYFFNEQSAIKMAKQIEIQLLFVDFSFHSFSTVVSAILTREKLSFTSFNSLFF